MKYTELQNLSNLLQNIIDGLLYEKCFYFDINFDKIVILFVESYLLQYI